jgi:hypothetical protein
MVDSAITFTSGEVSAYYAARVPTLKQVGREWRGACPIHCGKGDNFAVEAASGEAYCHSVCGRGWDMIGLEMALTGSNFKTARAGVFGLLGRIEPEFRHNGTHTNGNSAGTVPSQPTKPTGAARTWRKVARYPYRDRDGNLLFEVIRYVKPDGEKVFRQCRPDGRGAVIWNLDGIERVPYRLPELLKAETVYLPEGEKDVHTLEAWGLVASCNPGGSGSSALYAGWADYFRDRHVVILLDNDGPGRKHAAAVAAALLGTAASVRIVELPGLPARGDVTDWRDAGGTFQLFHELTEAAAVMDAAALSELQARWRLAHEEPHQARGDAEGEWSKPDASLSPWPAPIKAPTPSGSQLLDEIERYIRRYVVLPEPAYLPVALWVLATHAVQHFDCFPYLAALSAAKRSGKTRLAEVLQMLVRRPWHGTAPSPAALYRMLEGAPTLLLDEIEVLSRRNSSETTQILISVLNAGHRKGATIPRCEPPKFDVRYFNVYGPKMFAAIGRLPDTLADRSIVIRMKRRSKSQKVERFRQVHATAQGKPIQDGAAHFVQAHAAEIEHANQQVLEADLEYLNDRDADVWSPLFAICTVIMPERLRELEKCARTLSAAKAGEDADDSLALTLLRDIKSVWPEGEDNCSTAALLDKLNATEESPWSELEHKLTPRKLARMLRPFEVRPQTVRVGNETPKGYRYADFQDAFDLYLEEKCATSATNQ